jgi:hypothetical protein
MAATWMLVSVNARFSVCRAKKYEEAFCRWAANLLAVTDEGHW